ncbi:ABC transporter ATP-binding protein [Arthrobacter crusticola]|nr:ATP-binding cassette domain-containing protein [Arthrobacter crusticola]
MTSEVEFVEGQPAVVLDGVSMTYQVPTTAQDSASPRKPRGLRRLLGRQRNVSVIALKDISLVVNRGESVGIIGRNGSGKSTLMKLINGRVPPTAGAVYASSRPTLLGVSAALVPDLSGHENIVLGCLAMGMTRAEIDRKYEDIVSVSGLAESIGLPMRTYSSGMAARLQFAIATAVDTEILLIDEALNTGDDQFKDRTKAKMDELREKAGCVFLVSHSLDTIREMCSRVLWLDDGEIIMDGDPVEVIKWYRTFTKYLSAGDRVLALKTRRRMINNLKVPAVLARESGRRSSA